MKIRRFLRTTAIFIIILSVVINSVPILAVSTDPYNVLFSQVPKYIKNCTLDDVSKYYNNASYSEILNPNENNYLNSNITVAEKKVNAHIYMRVFNITNCGNYTIDALVEKTYSAFDAIKDALKTKYIKCIAYSYSIMVSGKKDIANNKFKNYKIYIFIATGESFEQNREVVNNFVLPFSESIATLAVSNQFLAINQFILNGQFRYDVSGLNRCSTYRFINDGKGVCEEYAGMTSLILDALGYSNIIVTGTTGDINHMWNMVDINGAWYNLDVLWDGPVDSSGYHTEITADYLLRSTKAILMSHKPNAVYYSYTSIATVDYGFMDIPSSLVGNAYSIDDKYVASINIGTTVGAVRDTFEHKDYVIIARKGVPLADNINIATGDEVVLSFYGIKLDILIASVIGDLDGNGVINTNDSDMLCDYILERLDAELDLELVFKSANINHDERVTVSDYIMLKKMI